MFGEETLSRTLNIIKYYISKNHFSINISSYILQTIKLKYLFAWNLTVPVSIFIDKVNNYIISVITYLKS